MDIMKNQIRSYPSLAASLIFALGALLTPGAALAVNVSKTATAGAYSVTLKVLPAESFRGPKADMVRDGGAEPNLLNGAAHPNHHLVAFERKRQARGGCGGGNQLPPAFLQSGRLEEASSRAHARGRRRARDHSLRQQRGSPFG